MCGPKNIKEMCCYLKNYQRSIELAEQTHQAPGRSLMQDHQAIDKKY
jgi:hypothetical protein